MSWSQMVLAVPIAMLLIAVVHDFVAGLGEERLWSDPALQDPESFRNRAAAAEKMRPATTSVTSVKTLLAAVSTAVGQSAGVG